MALIFYDTETTGTDPFFDQILQFAAIKTDENFNELERFEIRCRLLPHVVPHPMAMLVTGVTAEMLTDTSLPTHYEMMCAVKDKLEEWSPAVFIGYNSLRFDEAMLRSALYQNLLPIYLTNTNGNGRSDALQLMQASTVFSPGVLTVPLNEQGRPVFKLDQLAPANGFSHEHAHDALADVEATIYMTKKVALASPDLWKRIRNSAEKRIVTEFINNTNAFLLTEFFYNKGYSRFVAPIGQHPNNSNTIFAVTLDDQFDTLTQAKDGALEDLLASTLRPVRRIRINASPLITSLEAVEKYKALDFPCIDNVRERASFLNSNLAIRDRIIKTMVAIEGEYEQDAEAEIEERIYEGFYSTADERRIATFHQVSWEERPKIAAMFEDSRLRELAKRLIYFHAPNAIDERSIQTYRKSIAKRFSTGDISPGWLTPTLGASLLSDALQEVSDTKRQHLLRGLEAIYRKKETDFSV